MSLVEELRAAVASREGAHEDVYVPARLGLLRAALLQIEAQPPKPATCPRFLSQSLVERDGCARCGLPRATHPPE